MVQEQSDAGDALAKLVARAQELRENGTTEDERWMLDLHRDLTARFISDNTRIWTTGSIFVAIAFASLAISPDVLPSKGVSAFAAAGTSISLLIIWNLIADRHREFQDRSFRWISAIEGFYLPSETPKPSNSIFWLKKARVLRWLLPIVLALGWAARLSPVWLPQ